MSTWFRTATWFRLGISALLGLSCVGATSASFAAKVEDRIAAIVNSDLIMLSEVRRELAPERERLEKHYRGEELSRRLQMAEAMALTTMIERRLQLQEAKARSVEVGDQEGKQADKQRKKQGEKIDEKDQVRTNTDRGE